MKLIITGATGFLGRELVRQGLRRSDVTSLVVVSRSPVQLSADDSKPEVAGKLKQVLIEDYTKYTDDAKQAFAGANACIWTVAITPGKSKGYEFEEVRKICQTSTVNGLDAMYAAGPSSPFRFVYLSGPAVNRDLNAKPRFPLMVEYGRMRANVEQHVLDFADSHKGQVEALISRPGLISGGAGISRMLTTGLLTVASPVVPQIGRTQLADVLIDKAINGFTEDLEVDRTMLNEEMKKMYQELEQRRTTAKPQ